MIIKLLLHGLSDIALGKVDSPAAGLAFRDMDQALAATQDNSEDFRMQLHYMLKYIPLQFFRATRTILI
jgi:hypothetical protein